MSENDQSVIFDATQEGVAFVRMNRPKVHNAMNADLISRMNDILEELRGADGVRVVFLEGVGKSFSAGMDLDHMKKAANMSHAENFDDGRRLAQMLNRIRTLPMPTIALVNGAAMGGGVGLAAACDIAVADRTAYFSLSEVKLGLIPATISPYVIEAIGPRNARRYFTTAERFDADEAYRIGLVHSVVEDQNALQNEAERFADAIVKNGPKAVTAAKDLINDVVWREIDHHILEETAKRIADIRSTDEGIEGTSAFLEKRKPSWTE
jgi:methylglutaconyl-CoA hydratase